MGQDDSDHHRYFGLFSHGHTSNDEPEAVTSLAFAPLGFSCSVDAILALGLENGLIELWKCHVAQLVQKISY